VTADVFEKSSNHRKVRPVNNITSNASKKLALLRQKAKPYVSVMFSSFVKYMLVLLKGSI